MKQWHGDGGNGEFHILVSVAVSAYRFAQNPTDATPYRRATQCGKCL